MKAVCKERVFEYVGSRIFVVEAGDVVNYTVKNRMFIVNDIIVAPTIFFNKFKVMEGSDKMKYSDFEYILCNYVFRDAVLFPEEYNGLHHLIIQGWGNTTIMISAESEEHIRVSYPDCQKIYTDYESALEAIKNH